MITLTALITGADRRQPGYDQPNTCRRTTYDEIAAVALVIRTTPTNPMVAASVDAEQIFGVISVRSSGARYSDDQIEMRWPARFGVRRCVFVTGRQRPSSSVTCQAEPAPSSSADFSSPESKPADTARSDACGRKLLDIDVPTYRRTLRASGTTAGGRSATTLELEGRSGGAHPGGGDDQLPDVVERIGSVEVTGRRRRVVADGHESAIRRGGRCRGLGPGSPMGTPTVRLVAGGRDRCRRRWAEVDPSSSAVIAGAAGPGAGSGWSSPWWVTDPVVIEGMRNDPTQPLALRRRAGRLDGERAADVGEVKFRVDVEARDPSAKLSVWTNVCGWSLCWSVPM